MKQPRQESRWAKMKRWADEHEAARQEDARLAPERERVQAQQREVERFTEEKRLKLAHREAMLNTAVPLLAVLAGTMALFLVASQRYELVRRGGVPSALSLACLWGALNVYGLEVAYMQRKFRGALHLSGWLTLSVFLLPFSYFTFQSAGIFLNGVLDQKPVQTRRPRIAERWMSSSSKGGTRYYLCLHDWKNPSAIIQIETSREIYEQAEAGKVAIIGTKPGFFGFEWVVSQSVR